MRTILSFLLLFSLLTSCEVKVKSATEDESTTKEEKKEKPARKKTKIKNNIEIETTGGVKVEQAFLTYEDDGSLVPEENVTAINRPVKLNLVVKGWEENSDGLVYIDAAQKIQTSDDDLILHRKGMLDGLGGIKPEDARYLRFNFVITRLNELVDYFVVDVVARNKYADQEIKATYKMHIE